MPIALARRYRPRRFADLVVQDHVATALRGAVMKDRVGHGYLLTGPRGVGKTTAARILAMALNCENRGADGEPCGECSSCLKIWNGSVDIDVVEIDAASNRGVDDARGLRESAMYSASQAGHHKVFIVDEAHMLTREAWNVLLKILEEPPPGVVFVFATTEPQKIANTAAPVMSRLQRFDFRRIGPAAIQQRLRQVLDAEHLDAEDDALLVIARHADGGMRDALSVLDQCLSFGDGKLTADRVRQALGLMDEESYAQLLQAVVRREPGAIFRMMDQVTESGADLAEFAGGLSEMLRALLMHQYGAAPEGITDSAKALIVDLASQLAPEDALRMLKTLGEAEPGIRRGANPRIALETLLLRWTMMERAADLRAVLGGAPPPPPPLMPSPLAATSVAAATAPPPAPKAARAASAPAAKPPVAAVPTPAAPPLPSATDASISAGWDGVVATAGRQSSLLAQALSQATPSLGDDGVLSLVFGPDSALFQDGLARQIGTVETIVAATFGRALPLRITTAATPETPGTRPRRLTSEQARGERLAQLRGRDPALDAAANALDLELLDEE
jgi:DNA polymerase-3 subunit gamma/tau